MIISDLKLPVYKSTELYDTIGHVRLSDRDKNAKFTYQVNSDFINIRKEALLNFQTTKKLPQKILKKDPMAQSF